MHSSHVVHPNKYRSSVKGFVHDGGPAEAATILHLYKIAPRERAYCVCEHFELARSGSSSARLVFSWTEVPTYLGTCQA